MKVVFSPPRNKNKEYPEFVKYLEISSYSNVASYVHPYLLFMIFILHNFDFRAADLKHVFHFFFSAIESNSNKALAY